MVGQALMKPKSRILAGMATDSSRDGNRLVVFQST